MFLSASALRASAMVDLIVNSFVSLRYSGGHPLSSFVRDLCGLRDATADRDICTRAQKKRQRAIAAVPPLLGAFHISRS
jgi:hypothetical protein